MKRNGAKLTEIHTVLYFEKNFVNKQITSQFVIEFVDRVTSKKKKAHTHSQHTVTSLKSKTVVHKKAFFTEHANSCSAK